MGTDEKGFWLSCETSTKQSPFSNASIAGLVLFLFILPVSARAQYTCFTNGTGIVITKYTGPGGGVTIPDTISGLPVTTIGGWAFSDRTDLTSVTIPDSVRWIDWYAFPGCSSLTNVTLGGNVTTIGQGAFINCRSLLGVRIPASVTSIYAQAFSGCINMSAITVEGANPVYSSSDGVLFDKIQTELIQYPAGKVGSYTVPKSVTTIRDRAFETCSGLTSLDIPSGVTSIGAWAFYSCTSLTDITIPASLTRIEGGTFDSCYQLTSIRIPNSVMSLESHAFASCTSLTNVIIGNGVTNIGSGAFAWCRSLTSVTIPDSVTTIGDWAFQACTSLTAIPVEALNLNYSSLEDVLFDKSQTTLIRYPPSKTGVSYTVPNTVSKIENVAFEGCWELTVVTIPNSVTSMGDFAFDSCTNLTSITIPNVVSSIGHRAFARCKSLTSITIPISVISIGDAAFESCSALSMIAVDALNPAYSSLGGVLFNKSQTKLIQFPGGKAGGYTIPAGVTSIGGLAFSFCTSLADVTIPNSVTNIGNHAFYACTSLTSVTIPDSITSIGGGAFQIGAGLTGVYFKGNAPSVGVSVFAYDNNTTVYYLPGTTGWSATFGSRPTALWVLSNPVILDFGSSFGIRTNRFGFIISWATNASVAVEACTDLGDPIWSPLRTNTLIGGWSYFSDPQWTNYPARFYRVRWP